MIFFLKLIIWNIDIHTCLLDSTFLCPHLYIIREYIDVQCTVKVQWVYSSILHNNFKNEGLSNDHWKTSGCFINLLMSLVEMYMMSDIICMSHWLRNKDTTDTNRSIMNINCFLNYASSKHTWVQNIWDQSDYLKFCKYSTLSS